MSKYHFNSILQKMMKQSLQVFCSLKSTNKWESNLKRVLKSVGLTFASIYRFNLALVLV